MDRTVIAPWKAEEKEQSERLYRKLQGLALVHPMPDEMKKLLNWDMFLKPNQAAFFHVMYYLFRLLDPAEFKRRFFWPITDKKSEANFRSSTVEYLKHLNEKHQLQWTNIKSYLVVMPGGMRFINFLLEFVGFVIRELIKQREKSLADSDVQNADVKVMARQNAVMKDYASDYVANLEENMALLKHNTQKIRRTIEDLAKEAGIPEELLLDENFLEEFEASNRRALERKISQPAEKDFKLEESLCGLKEDIEKFQAKQSEHNRRKEAVDSVLNGFRGIFGSETFTEEDFDDPLIGSKIEALVKAFNQVSSTVAEQLDANDHYNESNEFVTTDLRALRVEVAQIESQLTNVQKDLNTQQHQIRERKEAEEKEKRMGALASTQLQLPTTPRLESRFQDIASKFVSTPPIRIDLAGASGSSAPVRLALQDDYHAKQFDAFSNSLLAPAPPRSARKPKGLDQSTSADLNGTMNRSKINDPMELLRTIHKNTNKPRNAPQANISSLGSKWKQMQASFGFDEASAPAATSPQKSSADSCDPFTPLSGSDCTRVERVVTETANSLMAKSAAVMKVLKDASQSFQNLSTSPSGRLDALVAGPQSEFPLELTPRLQVNNVTILESQAFRTDSNKENNVNVPNLSLFDFSKNGDDDDLLNISDSILKDIIM
ncbi:hypothetical protein KR026_009013 [Drosophila bipectinata]|nr:hypothetical protein KR026_009013 [Drosophila bipectinata]